MVEIIHTFRLLDIPQTTQPITPFRTFHLAEGPGGFIEAIANIRCNSADEYIGMTLIDDRNDNIPGWKKSKEFLLKTQNVVLEKGADGTGNILSIENLHYCFHKYSSSMDFITGDGGFDFSVNFNEQEKVMLPLLFAQVCYALLLQRKGGTFVLKIFDCFMKSTIDIIYILSSFYEKVYIMKPQTSRYANSERYIICIGFLHESNHLFSPNIIRTFEEMVCAQAVRATIPGFLSIPLQYIFIKRIEECNSVIGQQQLENIYSTINLIENKHKNDKIDFLKKTNIQRCVAWCVQHNMQYNNV
jgi:23S rRNA U2552 (ribose-2'-O)-methylase RlmE/FtsJ